MTQVLSLWKGLVARPHLTAREIIQTVADEHGLTFEHLVGPQRRREYCIARHEAIWLCRQVKTADGRHRHSLPSIGRIMGGRDHTTMLHAIRRHEERMAQERMEETA